MASFWRQPHASRALLAGLFAAAFLANGGLGLWVSLTARPSHVNGMSAVIFVFGLVAAAAATQQFLLSSPAKRGRGIARSAGEGASRPDIATAAPPPSAEPVLGPAESRTRGPPPSPLRRGGEIAPMSAVSEHP